MQKMLYKLSATLSLSPVSLLLLLMLLFHCYYYQFNQYYHYCYYNIMMIIMANFYVIFIFIITCIPVNVVIIIIISISTVLFLLLLCSQVYLWGSLFWVRFFNPTIEVVTFHLHGWCRLSVFLLPAFTRLEHESQNILSPCNGMHVCTD